MSRYSLTAYARRYGAIIDRYRNPAPDFEQGALLEAVTDIISEIELQDHGPQGISRQEIEAQYYLAEAMIRERLERETGRAFNNKIKGELRHERNDELRNLQQVYGTLGKAARRMALINYIIDELTGTRSAGIQHPPRAR